MKDLNALRVAFATDLDVRLGSVPVALDVRDINPPCVLVGLPSIDFGAGTVDLPVHVIAPGPGNTDAVDWLLATVADVVAEPLEGYRPTEAQAGDYSPEPNRFLPAYRITYRIPDPFTFC